MDPILLARFRRHIPVAAAIAIGLLFLAAHTALFRPLEQRYRRALAAAGPIGATLDPSQASRALPPRVYTLLIENARGASQLDRDAQSGALAGELMQALSGVARRHGLDVIVSEPRVLTQQPTRIQVRAHLRMRGRYADLVGFLDDLSSQPGLYRLERLLIEPGETGVHDIEIHVAQLLLKRPEAGS